MFYTIPESSFAFFLVGASSSDDSNFFSVGPSSSELSRAFFLAAGASSSSEELANIAFRLTAGFSSPDSSLIIVSQKKSIQKNRFKKKIVFTKNSNKKKFNWNLKNWNSDVIQFKKFQFKKISIKKKFNSKILVQKINSKILIQKINSKIFNFEKQFTNIQLKNLSIEKFEIQKIESQKYWNSKKNISIIFQFKNCNLKIFN